MKFIHIFLIIYINITLYCSLNNENSMIAIFPFKTFLFPNKSSNEQFSSKEYLDIIHSSLIYLDIEIGKNVKEEKINKEILSKIKNNKQFLSLFVLIDNYDFYIDDNYFYDEEKKKYCRYSTFLSTSYEIDNNFTTNLKDSFMAFDYIKVYNDKNIEKENNYQFLKMNFRHSYDKNRNISFACGKVGLLVPKNNLYMETKSNFINQIHHTFGKVDYSFSIQYNHKDNIDDMEDGILIIGEESMEKKINPDIMPIYPTPKGYGGNLEWEFEINQIFIGDKILESENEDFDILIKSTIDGIQIPYFFYQELNSLFFNKCYSNQICQYEQVNNLYIVISCDSDKFSIKNVESFPDINFFKYKIGFNFTFSGKDLFIKKGNKYFFKMVTYSQSHLKSFYFGRLFLKKYKVILNSDSKTMYFFDNKKNINMIENNDGNNFALKCFSYIFIGSLFLVIGLCFGRRYCIKKKENIC